MNINEIKNAINTFYERIMTQLIQEHGENHEKLIKKWLEIHELYLEKTNHFLEKFTKDSPEKITATNVVIEITDQDTGKIFRRNLPLDYLETDNGIRLSGENLEGTPSQLVFLSDTAVFRIKDILGKGSDSHTCHD